MSIVNQILGFFNPKRTERTQRRRFSRMTEEQVTTYIKDCIKRNEGCQHYHLMIRQTEDKDLARALLACGFPYELVRKAEEKAKLDHVIVATVHYERAEHLAEMLRKENPALKVSIMEA